MCQGSQNKLDVGIIDPELPPYKLLLVNEQGCGRVVVQDSPELL